MPYIVVDYSKCNGSGACIASCPGSVFEKSQNGQWCKPIDTYVKNPGALEAFSERVLSSGHAVPIAIRYHLPECYLCWQCVGACPKQAIDVDYDYLETREYLLPAGSVSF